ncbi:MAG: DUF4188 domain-containing protein [Rhodococcus sp. (in: high G+C Gram-positive bacteria)]
MSTRTVLPGRYIAAVDGDFVVFVIGMRINRLRKVRRWVGPFLAMPAMLRELRAHPEKGLLGARMYWGGRTITVVQYWRSAELLEAFARNPNDPHLPAWRAFNTKVGVGKDVGVYHETYRIGAGQFETIYSNMPVMGLAEAGRSVSA